MNIAFPALIVLLLLLPGILLRFSHRRGFFNRSPVTLAPVRDEIGPGIVLGLFIHPAALVLLQVASIDGPTVDTFLTVVNGATSNSSSPPSEAVVGGLWYLIGVNLTALVAGTGLHALVRWQKLDLRYDWLRFSNEWYYIFSGEARVFKANQEDRDLRSIKRFLDRDFDFVFISVVVIQGDVPVLYWGALVDYHFDASGRLEKIVLDEAHRRPLRADEDGTSPKDADTGAGAGNAGNRNAADRPLPFASERFVPIRGSYLVIDYADVRTLNVEYKVFAEE
jgi:hypothetical protein